MLTGGVGLTAIGWPYYIIFWTFLGNLFYHFSCLFFYIILTSLATISFSTLEESLKFCQHYKPCDHILPGHVLIGLSQWNICQSLPNFSFASFYTPDTLLFPCIIVRQSLKIRSKVIRSEWSINRCVLLFNKQRVWAEYSSFGLCCLMTPVQAMTFSVMYDHNIFYVCNSSNLTSGYKWNGLSVWWLHMTTLTFLKGLCRYIWVNILTLSP